MNEFTEPPVWAWNVCRFAEPGHFAAMKVKNTHFHCSHNRNLRFVTQPDSWWNLNLSLLVDRVIIAN